MHPCTPRQAAYRARCARGSTLRHRGRRSDGHIGPILPDLRDELEFGYAVGALHLSTFAVGALMASPTARTAVGALGLRRLLWLSVGGMASGCLLLAVGRSVVATLLATSLLGWFTASIVHAVQALLSAHHGEGRTVALVEADVAASLGADPGKPCRVAEDDGPQPGV
jgi:predicted MFS family arabinose efflux permease